MPRYNDTDMIVNGTDLAERQYHAWCRGKALEAALTFAEGIGDVVGVLDLANRFHAYIDEGVVADLDDDDDA